MMSRMAPIRNLHKGASPFLKPMPQPSRSNGAILATVGLESLGLGASDVHTLGTVIYWARRYSAVLRGQWWWWGPPIVVIAMIFLGLFLTSVGFDRFANPKLGQRS